MTSPERERLGWGFAEPGEVAPEAAEPRVADAASLGEAEQFRLDSGQGSEAGTARSNASDGGVAHTPPTWRAELQVVSKSLEAVKQRMGGYEHLLTAEEAKSTAAAAIDTGRSPIAVSVRTRFAAP